MAQQQWSVRTGEDLGRALGDIRRRRGLSQEAAAEQVGLDRTYLAKLEVGRTSSSLEHLLRALRRLGATVTVTFEDPDGEA